MKILQAIKNKLRIADSKVAAQMSDPVGESRLAIEDSEKQIIAFRKAIAAGLASKKSLEKELENFKNDLKKFKSIAEQALAAGNEDDARQALEKKQNADTRVKSLTVEVKRTEGIVQNQRAMLEKADAKVSLAKQNQKTLALRLEGAKVRKELASASSNFDTGGGLSALDDLETQVNTIESEADAYEDLSGVNEVSLEEKYSSSNTSIEDELAKMKSKIK